MKKRTGIIILCIEAVVIALCACFIAYILDSQTVDKQEIREIAYNALSTQERERVINWEQAEMSEIKPHQEYLISMSDDEPTNIGGRDVFAVGFKYHDAETKGITVYIDGDTKEVIGTYAWQG